MTPLLDIQRVTLRREQTTILRDVSWRIAPGEHWALVGANGSGKTTLLKVATGYEWPTTGTVDVLGNRFGETNIPLLRRKLGWVSSALLARFPDNNRAVDIAVSGFEASMGLYRDFTEAEYDCARMALEIAGGGAIVERAWGVLSQGERQRALIARALVEMPALLILDEPCAGLDPAARIDFLNHVERLSGAPGAPGIILVTHHVEEIRPFITHVLVLKDGRVLAAGETASVLTSTTVSEAFGAKFDVRRMGEEYRLERVW